MHTIYNDVNVICLGLYMNANIIYVKTSVKKVSTISLYVGKPLSFLPGIIETHRHGLDMTHTTQYSLFEYLVYFFHVTLIDIELNSFHLHK